jgi:signal transduction histidine kinase
MHGLSPEAFQGKRLSEVAGGSSLSLESCLQKVLDSGQTLYNVELRGTLPGYPGESRLLSVTCFPVPTLDGGRGAAAILSDHTTLARCQKDLAEQRNLVDVVVEALKVVVCQWDVPSDTAEWGPFFTEAFGHPAGHITEAYAWWLNRIHPDDRAGFSEAFQRYQSTGTEDNWECTYSFQRANGTYAHVRHWFTAIRTADGRAERLLGAILDLTEENRLMSRLVQRNKDLETLVYIISHDLKEPLRSIRTFTDLLATEHAEHLNREGLDLLERLGRNSFRLDKLINEVLELSRAQQLEVPDRGTDGRALVMQAIAQLQDALDALASRTRCPTSAPMSAGPRRRSITSSTTR